MKVIIQLSRNEEAKALPILLRHSPGMVLRERTYVLSDDCHDSLLHHMRFARQKLRRGIHNLKSRRTGPRAAFVPKQVLWLHFS